MARDRRRLGWLSTLLALVMLVVVGFLFGAIAGFLWEEPRLVLAYLSGDTESVEWDAQEEADPLTPELPPVAAPPPPAPPVAKAAKAKAKAPAPKPAPVAATQGGFAVQVGAFGESAAAEKLVKRLQDRGYPAYVRASAAAGGSRWRVRVGPVAERSEAERLASKLEKGEKLPTWVLEEGEG